MSHGQNCFRSDGDWVCGGGCTDARDEREADKSARIARLTAERDALAAKLEEATRRAEAAEKILSEIVSCAREAPRAGLQHIRAGFALKFTVLIGMARNLLASPALQSRGGGK